MDEFVIRDGVLSAPEGVTVIPGDCFLYESFDSLRIPEGITEIGPLAFGGCRALEELRLPRSLRKIDPEAFRGCHSMFIVAERGSYAEEYAAKYGFRFFTPDDTPAMREDRYIINEETVKRIRDALLGD